MKYLKTYKIFEQTNIHSEIGDAVRNIKNEFERQISDCILELEDTFNVTKGFYYEGDIVHPTDPIFDTYIVDFECDPDQDIEELIHLLNKVNDKLIHDMHASVYITIGGNELFGGESYYKIDYESNKDDIDRIIKYSIDMWKKIIVEIHIS